MTTQKAAKLIFGKTVMQAAKYSGSTVKQMYALAQRLQPEEAKGGPCTHRATATRASREWQHQLRRDVQALLSAGCIRPANEGRNRVYVRG